MNLMRNIIEWCDKKMEEACQEPNQLKGNAKAFACGCVEGFCDGALLMYVPLLITCVCAGRKLKDE